MRITSLQATLVRRVNRDLQIMVNGNQLKAVLPLPVQSETKGNMVRESYNRFLIVRNVENGYEIETYIETRWKRFYWTKWRNQKQYRRTFSGNNFNQLLNMAKLSAFEK